MGTRVPLLCALVYSKHGIIIKLKCLLGVALEKLEETVIMALEKVADLSSNDPIAFSSQLF